MDFIQKGKRLVIGIMVLILLNDIFTIAVTSSKVAANGKLEYISFFSSRVSSLFIFRIKRRYLLCLDIK